jgi:hypothetical protein
VLVKVAGGNRPRPKRPAHASQPCPRPPRPGCRRASANYDVRCAAAHPRARQAGPLGSPAPRWCAFAVGRFFAVCNNAHAGTLALSKLGVASACRPIILNHLSDALASALPEGCRRALAEVHCSARSQVSLSDGANRWFACCRLSSTNRSCVITLKPCSNRFISQFP